MAIDLCVLGRVDYAATVQAMQDYTATRTPESRDLLWICEHDAIYTQGIAGKSDHILRPGNIPVVATNRGGQVTFHGPGQVVAYPLIDLQRAGYFVKEYVYRIEEAVIRTLAHFGVTGHRVAGAPGIYVRLDDPHSHAMLEQRLSPAMGAKHLKNYLKTLNMELTTIARACGKQNVEDLYMLLTDVPKEESVVISDGRYASEVLSDGFETQPAEDGSFTLPGVVSRKKQFIPALMTAYQEL